MVVIEFQYSYAVSAVSTAAGDDARAALLLVRGLSADVMSAARKARQSALDHLTPSYTRPTKPLRKKCR